MTASLHTFPLRPRVLNNAGHNLAQPAPTGCVVNFPQVRGKQRHRGSDQPRFLIHGYMLVARESELRKRQIDQLIELGNAALARFQR